MPGNNEFCRECQNHILTAQAFIDECAGQPCNRELYERIGFQFLSLRAKAQPAHKIILNTYAQEMASFARYLQYKMHEPVSQAEHDLLMEGISFGLACDEGRVHATCPEMHFDRLWDLVGKMRTCTEKAPGKQAANW